MILDLRDARIIALLANPVGHSLSPYIHAKLNEYYGNNYKYLLCEVEADELASSVKQLVDANALGFNVSIPYKERMPQILDWFSEDVKATGSVNTVKIIDGHTEGYSTDGPGFLEAFKLQTGTTVEKKSIFIFGAGGSAAAIAYACIKAGSEEIYIANRSYENTEKLCNRLNPNICTPLHLDWEEYRRYIKFSSIIINTTPLGMLGKEEFSPMRDSQKLSPHQIVYDIVYNPSVTTFMLQGIKNECPTFNGLGMLIMQAILSYQIWTENKPLPEKILIELFNSILVDLQKIIREAEEKQ